MSKILGFLHFTGLELVAAELGGRKKIKKLLEPFNCKSKVQCSCRECSGPIQVMGRNVTTCTCISMFSYV